MGLEWYNNKNSNKNNSNNKISGVNWLGQVHKPGVAAALAKIEAQALTNVRIVQGDVITALCDHVEDRSLDGCCIFFPDPFPRDSDADRWADGRRAGQPRNCRCRDVGVVVRVRMVETCGAIIEVDQRYTINISRYNRLTIPGIWY